MLKLPNGLLTPRVDRLIQVWQTWELFKKIKLVKGRNIYLTTNWPPPVSNSSWVKRKKSKSTWRHTLCDLLHYGTSSESDRLIEVKTIKNNLLETWKRWPRPLNTGDCLMQVSFTVIKGNDFRDFVKWPLNRGWPRDRGLEEFDCISFFSFVLNFPFLILNVPKIYGEKPFKFK